MIKYYVRRAADNFTYKTECRALNPKDAAEHFANQYGLNEGAVISVWDARAKDQEAEEKAAVKFKVSKPRATVTLYRDFTVPDPK